MPENKHPAKRPHPLTRLHHSPLFWVGAAIFLAAMLLYIFSEDLRWLP